MKLEELIPHRGKMLLIDSIKKWDLESLQAVVAIKADALFADAQGNIPAWVGIEYMAQSIAAYAGAQYVYRQEPVKIGFLIGTRVFDSYVDCFLKEESYLIDVRLLFKDSGLGAFDCQITNEKNGSLCCVAKVNVFEPENPKLY